MASPVASPVAAPVENVKKVVKTTKDGKKIIQQVKTDPTIPTSILSNPAVLAAKKMGS